MRRLLDKVLLTRKGQSMARLGVVLGLVIGALFFWHALGMLPQVRAKQAELTELFELESTVRTMELLATDSLLTFSRTEAMHGVWQGWRPFAQWIEHHRDRAMAGGIHMEWRVDSLSDLPEMSGRLRFLHLMVKTIPANGRLEPAITFAEDMVRDTAVRVDLSSAQMVGDTTGISEVRYYLRGWMAP